MTRRLICLCIAASALPPIVNGATAATPISFHISFEVEPIDSNLDDLVGARFDAVLNWDPTTLFPYSHDPDSYPLSWQTYWPSTNTTGSVTISGTATIDGTYPITSVSGEWQFMENAFGFADGIRYPKIEFELNSQPASISQFLTGGPEEFVKATGQTIYPLPFEPWLSGGSLPKVSYGPLGIYPERTTFTT